MLDANDSCPCGSKRRFGHCHGEYYEVLQRQYETTASEIEKIELHQRMYAEMRLAAERVRRPALPSDLLPSDAARVIDRLATCIKRTTNRALRRQACDLLRVVMESLIANEELDHGRIGDGILFVLPSNVWEHTASLLASAKGVRTVPGTPSAESRLWVALRRRSQWVDASASTQLDDGQRGALLSIINAFDDWILAGEIAHVRMGGSHGATFAATLEGTAMALNGEGSPYLSAAEQQWLNPSFFDPPSPFAHRVLPDYEERLQKSKIEAWKLLELWILLTCALQRPEALQHVRINADSSFLREVADGLQARRTPQNAQR